MMQYNVTYNTFCACMINLILNVDRYLGIVMEYIYIYKKWSVVQ